MQVVLVPVAALATTLLSGCFGTSSAKEPCRGTCMTPEGEEGCIALTSRRPESRDEVFLPAQTIAVDINGDTVIDDRDRDDEGDLVMELDERFDDRSPWIPDADSFDDFSVTMPVSSDCPADGRRTGPTDKIDPETHMFFTTIDPSSFCRCVVD